MTEVVASKEEEVIYQLCSQMQCGIIPYIPCKCDLAIEDVLILLCNQVHYKAQLLSRQKDHHSSLQL
jgi:hypothetical protein